MYGDIMDRAYIYSTTVGRVVEQQHHCICNDGFWKQYAITIKDASKCVLTTDTECLRDNNVAAALKTQAGFRPEYVGGSLDRRIILRTYYSQCTSMHR